VVVLGIRPSAGRVGGQASLVALLSMLVACSAAETTDPLPSGSSGASASSGSGAASGSSPSVSPKEVARTQATAAYVGMWQDMARAARTSDWRSPSLARHATGDALSAISRGMYADHRNGLVTKGAPKNYPKVSAAVPEANPTTVMISDCGDSTHWLRYRRDTGRLADGEVGGRQAITAEVKKADGVWRVSRFAVQGVGSC